VYICVTFGKLLTMATQNEFRRVEKKEEIKVSLLLQVDDVDE